MEITSLNIPDVKLIRPDRFSDERGTFSETFNRPAFLDAGIESDFMQDNHAISLHVGTLRGLHFQSPPFAQAKLVRVLRGTVIDVVVDIRVGSPTFGQHSHVRMAAQDWMQLYVPAGFAHAYLTLEANTEVLYKVDARYSPEHQGGLLWSDPDLAIQWPVPATGPLVSDRDKTLPRLRDLQSPFRYNG